MRSGSKQIEIILEIQEGCKVLFQQGYQPDISMQFSERGQMAEEGLKITGQFVVAEIKKSKSDSIRVTRALVNGAPYVFLQLFSSWNEGKIGPPKPVGKPISLRIGLVNTLIETLASARDWLD